LSSQLRHGLSRDLIERMSNRRVGRGDSDGHAAPGPGRERELHPEQGAAIGAVPDLDAATVAFDELLGDGKPETRSPEAPRGAVVSSPEPFEDRLA